MPLLDIVQGVAIRVGLQKPTVGITSTDPLVLQIIALAQDAGDDLVERWDWTGLKGLAPPTTFTGDGVSATHDLPVDFKSLSPSSVFVSSLYPTLTLRGPVNEDDLVRMKSLPVVARPSVWRRIGNSIEFFPVLASGEVVSYVYARNYWIMGADNTARNAWTSDGDTPIIPERLIRLGAIWMWKRAKGFDYAEEFAQFERAFARLSAGEDTEREISMADSGLSFDEGTWQGTLSGPTYP